ncbi:MAG: hypothetical protein Q8898_08280 [Bacillota bacterium]|nr:hypothetical protein [Bacillota bacterium]
MKENKPQQEKSPKKKKEQLSRKDIEELMNMHIDTYTRKNGAWRRK